MKLLETPSKKELKNAIDSIRNLLKNQYADNSPQGQKRLLVKLQQTADESLASPVDRYALLTECVAAATAFGSVNEGWAACDQIQAAYDVKQLPQIEFLKNIKTTVDQQSARSLYLRGSEKIHQLIDKDRFDDAENLTKALEYSIRESLPAANEDLWKLSDRAKSLKRKFKKIEDDLEALQIDPLNQVANAEVGIFYCEEKRDFKRGLPYLAKSPNRKIQALAKLELNLNKPTVEKQLAIAERWWDLGKDKKLDSFLVLATQHYQQIVNDLEGQPKITAQNRIKEALPLADISITQLLSDYVWQVKWTNGDQWQKLRIEQGRVRVSLPSGNVFFLELVEVNGIAELRSRSRKLDLRVTHQNGNLLQLIKLDRQGKPTNVTAIASKIIK